MVNSKHFENDTLPAFRSTFGARVLKILGGLFQIPEHVIFKQP